LKQSTFYPFMLFRRFAGGSSLDVLVQCPKYETKQFGDVPLLDVSACLDEAGGRQAVFAVNRSQTDPAVVELVWQSGAPSVLDEVHQVAGADPKAANSFEQPNVVTAKKLPSVPVSDARAVVELPPLSFTVMAASGSG
jgi:alpha-N-arabinofuranosidase